MIFLTRTLAGLVIWQEQALKIRQKGTEKDQQINKVTSRTDQLHIVKKQGKARKLL